MGSTLFRSSAEGAGADGPAEPKGADPATLLAEGAPNDPGGAAAGMGCSPHATLTLPAGPGPGPAAPPVGSEMDRGAWTL